METTIKITLKLHKKLFTDCYCSEANIAEPNLNTVGKYSTDSNTRHYSTGLCCGRVIWILLSGSTDRIQRTK